VRSTMFMPQAWQRFPRPSEGRGLRVRGCLSSHPHWWKPNTHPHPDPLPSDGRGRVCQCARRCSRRRCRSGSLALRGERVRVRGRLLYHRHWCKPNTNPHPGPLPSDGRGRVRQCARRCSRRRRRSGFLAPPSGEVEVEGEGPSFVPSALVQA
jgi:hypothetical protein